MSDETDAAEAALALARARARAKAKKATPPRAPETQAPSVVAPETGLGTTLRGFGEGASLGFSGELRGLSGAAEELASRGGLGEAVVRGAAALPGPLPLGLAATGALPAVTAAESRGQLASYPDKSALEAMLLRYRADRDAANRELDRARAANPKLAIGSEVAGALTLPLGKGARGGTVAARVGQGAKTGATLGAAGGAGASREDLTSGGLDSLKGFLGDVGVGAGIGGAVGAVVPVAAELATERIFKPAAERLANSSAVRALLGRGELINRLKDRLGVRSEAGMQELGQDVREAGLLGRVVPRNVSGINEANQRLLSDAGGEIGDVITKADAASAEAVKRAAQTGAATWARPQPAEAAAAFRRGVENASQRSGVAMELAPEVSASASALEQPNIKTFRQLWDTKADLGRQAFPENVSRISDRKTLMQAGQQQAARQIESQLEQHVGPEEMARLQAAMKRYSLGKKIQGTVENAATRAEARGGATAGDAQGITALTGIAGLPAYATAGVVNSLKSRANSALALYAPSMAGAVGGVGRASLPAARQVTASIVDPLGPLRQYLGLDPDDRRQLSSDTFGAEGGF